MNIESTYDQRPPDRDIGPTVLVVDDEEGGRLRLKVALESTDDANSLHVLFSQSIPEALEVLTTTPVHVVLLDKNLGPDPKTPEHNGITMIPEMRKIQPHVQILMVTGSGSVGDIVEAMRNGAFGYLTKESKDELLVQQINKAIYMARLALLKAREDRAKEQSKGKVEFVTKSSAAKALFQQVQAVAESNRPVLLLGETGTGKTTLAEFIHEYRKRYLKQQDRPFFKINVSALPANLIEAELFGSEKGSFSRSVAMKQGFFELVNSGTFFLDEIGETSLEVQQKLLIAIEEGVFYRVGGKKELRSSFKLVCATNRNLREMVDKGLFREDLFMRISTFTIEVPPLSQRKEDVPDIIGNLLPRCCNENKVYVTFDDVPEDFIEYITNNPPPGNIRGIEQQLSRLLVFSPKDRQGQPMLKLWKNTLGLTVQPTRTRPQRDCITLEDLMTLPLDVVGSEFPGMSEITASIQERILLDAVEKLQKNRPIARALKLSDSAISDRMKRLEEKYPSLARSSKEPVMNHQIKRQGAM